MPYASQYGAVPNRQPSQPVASSRQPLKTSVSRVLSRCLSINRKNGPPVPPKEGEAVWNEGNGRQMDRSYEVVPRIASTHLTVTRTGNGFDEYSRPDLTGAILTPGARISDQTKQRTLRSSSSTNSDLSKLYSHPLTATRTPKRFDGPPRRPIQMKLSRNQIAQFRNASQGSQASKGKSKLFCYCEGPCEHGPRRRLSEMIAEIQQRESGDSIPGSRPVETTTPSSSTIAPAHSTRSLEATAGVESRPPSLAHIDTQQRRHLASSRSTAEMKGRSPTTPTRTTEAPLKSTSSAFGGQSFDTSTPRPQVRPKVEQNNEVIRFPHVCPERLVQRIRPSPSEPWPEIEIPEGMSPTFMRPRPAPPVPKSPVPAVLEQGPPLSPENISPVSIAGMMEYESTSPLNPVTPGPIDSETLERLFEEVLLACRTDMIPYKHERRSVEDPWLKHDLEEAISSAPSAVPVPRHVQTRLDWSCSSTTSDGDSTQVSRSISAVGETASVPRVVNDNEKAESEKVKEKVKAKAKEDVKRFIPSGRSFEPLRTVNIPNIPLTTSSSSRGDKVRILGSGSNSGSRGRVKEAIARFENASSTPPTTPLRVIGQILDRPSLVDSQGLSSESRRMMSDARMRLLPR